MPTPIPQVLDGKYVELWSVPAWRRKLGIGDVGQTLSERIREIIVESGGDDVDIDEAGTRLAEFATLNEAGYIVQTTVSPPTFAGRQIRGTANQINVLYGTGIPGDTVLSTPQNIHTAATPSFHTIKPTLLTREFVTYINGIGELASTSVTADALNTISAGIGGYFPYWLSAGGLSPTSPIYTDGTLVGIGTDLPAVLLDLGLAGTTAGVMRLAGSSSGNVTIQTAATAGTWTLTLPVNDGNAGDMLITDGAGITSWTAPTTVTPSALTKTDDTNVTLTLGGSPTVALLAATSLTLGWTGLLSMARGGTNKNMTASAGAVAYSDVDSLELTAIGTPGQVLTSQGAGTPTWTTPATLSTPVSIAEGGTNNTTFSTDSVIFFDGTRLTDDGAAFTFGVGGDNLLTVSRTMGEVVSDLVGIQVINSSGALLGAQQWSPTIMWEGQGWSTINGSRSVRFSAHVAPEGTTAINPTGYWNLTFNINNAATHTELFRADTTGFVRVTKDDIRITQGAYGLHLLNSTAATASSTLQQWSPPIIYEGQGWKTTAVAASQKVQLRNYVATVIGTTAPTAYFITDYDINATGTFTEALRLDTSGFYRLTKDALGATATTGEIGFQLFNNTAAAAGAQQHSPVVLFRGHGWKTNAVAASQRVQMRMHAVPVEGASAPTVMLRIDSEIAGAGSFTNPITIHSSGGMTVGFTTDPGFGVTNTQVGYRINNAAASGQFLVGNGTNFVATAVSSTTFSHDVLSATHTDTLASAVSRGSLIYGNATPKWAELGKGAANTVLRADATDVLWGQVVLTTDVTGVLPTANGGTNHGNFTAGSVLFAGAAGTSIEQSNSSFFWDYTLFRLGIGNGNPQVMLDLGLAGTRAGVLRFAGVTSGNVTIQTAAVAGTWTLTLPPNDGNAGDVLTTDGAGVATWSAPTASATHDMLSATHTDTLAAAVSEGSLIVGNVTPKWSELVIGAANRLLRSDGTSPSWAQAVLTTDVTGTLPLANGGTNNTAAASAGAVVYSNSTQHALTAVGSSGQVLLSDGTNAPFWSSGSPLLQLWEEGVGTDYTPPLDDQYYDVSFGTSGTLELSLTAGTWLVTSVMAWTNPSTFDVYFQYALGGVAQSGSEQIVIASGPAQTVLQYKVTVGSTTAIKVQIKTPNPAYSNVVVYSTRSNISAIRLTA